MNKSPLCIAFSASALLLLPCISHSSESIQCVELKPGRVFFLASEVNSEFDCAIRSGKGSFVNKVLSIDGDTVKIQNLENGVIWDTRKKLCGVASQDEAEAVTRQSVVECMANKTRR